MLEDIEGCARSFDSYAAPGRYSYREPTRDFVYLDVPRLLDRHVSDVGPGCTRRIRPSHRLRSSSRCPSAGRAAVHRTAGRTLPRTSGGSPRAALRCCPAEDRTPGLIQEGHGLGVNAYALHGRTRRTGRSPRPRFRHDADRSACSACDDCTTRTAVITAGCSMPWSSTGNADGCEPSIRRSGTSSPFPHPADADSECEDACRDDGMEAALGQSRRFRRGSVSSNRRRTPR